MRREAPPARALGGADESAEGHTRVTGEARTSGGAGLLGPYGVLLSGESLPRPPVGESMFLVHFGDNGRITGITENRHFLPEIYGVEIPVGDEWNAATLPGMFFNSASYGLDSEDRIGIAIVAHVRFFNFYMGQAMIYAWAPTPANDAFEGTFGYEIDFSDGVVSFLRNIADQYPVSGSRIAE